MVNASQRARLWRITQLKHLLLSIPLFAAIHFAAYWLRFEGELPEARWQQMACTLVCALCIKCAVFVWQRTYRSWNSYLTFYDLTNLVRATTLSSLLLVLCDYLFLARLAIPRSVFLMDWGGTIVVLGGLRAVSRWLQERGAWRTNRSGKRKSVFIIGANQHGEALLRSIRHTPSLDYDVVGFISDKNDSAGLWIGGIPIVGDFRRTCQLAKDSGVSQVLIASHELRGKQVRRLIEDARAQRIKIKVMPSHEQLLDERVDLRPRNVSIEDLLRREPVQLEIEALREWINDRVLMVTGGAGSIGAEICRQLLQFNPRKLVIVDRSENGLFFLERELSSFAHCRNLEICVGDVGDRARMLAIFRGHRPDIVFHAAAYKHVPLMEKNCGEAVKNIVLATRQLADLANEHDVTSFVMVSTDKAVNPTSVMGACKRVAELYVQALSRHSSCRFVTVRFGNVLDSAGSVVPIFREQIANGGPVTLTHPDMVRFFMMIPEASQLVIQAGAMGKGGEILVLDMGAPIRIQDLAHDMIRLSGLRVGEDIEVQITGVRPGEKLFEELNAPGEAHLPTSHPKIMAAAPCRLSLEGIIRAMNDLTSCVNRSDEQVVTELLKVVPHFQPPRIENPRRAA